MQNNRMVGVLTVAAVALAIAGATVPSAQADSWHCKGKKVERCIAKSGYKVTLKVTNKTRKSLKGEWGVTCGGGSGQHLKTLRKRAIPARSSWNVSLRRCPEGFRESVVGWWIRASDQMVYYTPYIDPKG